MIGRGRLGGDEMHRAAVELHTFLERATVCVQPGKRGEQRRVDVTMRPA